MNDEELLAIERRVKDATPTDAEPTPEDEIWQIRHILEVIQAYRCDVPLLIGEIKRLREALRVIANATPIGGWGEVAPQFACEALGERYIPKRPVP